MRTSFILIVLGFAFLAGCKTVTSPGNSTGTPITPPGAGSYFVYEMDYMDSTGTILFRDTETETFEATNLTVGGKSQVSKLVDSYADRPSDSGYIHYESNGDVTVWMPNDSIRGIFGTWITYPFGTQGTTTVSIDTSVNGGSLHMVFTLTGAGTGSSLVNGQTFTTEKVTEHILAVTTFSIGTSTYSDTVNTSGTDSFAPSLGDVIEGFVPGMRDPYTGAMGESTHLITVRYVVK